MTSVGSAIATGANMAANKAMSALGINLGGGDPAVSVCFLVSIDYMMLGAFNSCEGLAIEVVTETREEGGNNGMVWTLPTRIKYSNIRLTRPLTWQSSLTTGWFRTYARHTQRHTAVIEAHTSDNIPIGVWALDGVLPVKWSGPKLGPMDNTVATETLELAHQGFLSAGALAAAGGIAKAVL
jgi:phage tail-like protein